MRISTQQIRTVFEILMQHIEEVHGPEIEISYDYYWSIPNPIRYQFAQKPQKLTIGQLTDDWQELKRLTDSEKPPIGYCLVWLAAILRAIGHKYVA